MWGLPLWATITIWIALVLLILILIGVGTYFLIIWIKFKYRVIVLEDVQGSDDLEPVGRDKAMLVGVGKGGLEVLYLLKRKKYRGAYGKRMGKNRYYFAIGPDGYWYNVTLGSLNTGLGKVGINPTNVNMRYQNEALQEIIKQRYEKISFWQRYGGLLAFVALIAILGIMAYLVMDKFLELGGTMNLAIDKTKEVQETTKEIIGALDNLRASGGLRPAT